MLPLGLVNLVGVAVWIEELAEGELTDFNGKFMIRDIRSGRYTLRAALIGYIAYKHYNFQINADDTAQIEIQLQENLPAPQ